MTPPIPFPRLDRHAVRRSSGVPTVSVLVGPVGVGRRVWAEWLTRAGRPAVSARGHFPLSEWLATAAAAVPLPSSAVNALAARLGRDPDHFLAEWRVKTAADRERAWDAAPPHPDDDLLRALSTLPSDALPAAVAGTLAPFGDRAVAALLRLRPDVGWPGGVSVAGSVAELTAVADGTTRWAVRVPPLALAVTVPADVWADYLRVAPDGRTKSILREGEVEVADIDPAEADRLLAAAGVDGPVRAALAAGGADTTVAAAAAEVTRATAARPDTEGADDRARSAAEAFLFQMLERLPETAGRFELNGELDFRFGPRPAEVDLLCRGLRLAVEIDGIWHFSDPSSYRLDRTKDWELQRRGFVVLRFLAADVLPRFEEVRDRILDAVRTLPPGGVE